MGVSEVYADGVLQKLSMLSWRVGAVLSLNYGLLLRGFWRQLVLNDKRQCIVAAFTQLGFCSVGTARAPSPCPPLTDSGFMRPMHR